MKKLLLGSVILTIFAFAITIFQVSCQKESLAANDLSSEVSQLNKIVFLKGTGINETFIREIWTANYDGSDQKKLNITLPSGFLPESISISPDHQYLFIVAWNSGGYGNIYSCKMDGSNVTKIIDGLGLAQEGLNNVVSY